MRKIIRIVIFVIVIVIAIIIMIFMTTANTRSTGISRLLAQMTCEGLILGPNGIQLEEEAGTSQWTDGVPDFGPEGCIECGDEFDDIEVEDGGDRALATWHKLTVDFRDPEDFDVEEPEERCLCGHCAKDWKAELVGFGLVDSERTRLEIQREIIAATPATNENASTRSRLLCVLDSQIDDLALKGVA